jgi:AraC-like DNA-binding protein
VQGQSTQSFQRLGPIANVAQLAEKLGANPADISAQVGFDIRQLHADQRMPLQSAVNVLEVGAQLTRCPHFGLLVGASTVEETHGVIFQLAKTAPNLKQFWADHIAWQPGYTSGAIIYMHSFGEDCALGYGVVDRDAVGSVHFYDCVVAIGLALMRLAMGDTALPSEILMCRRAPADFQPYRKIIRVPIRFNESQTCMVFSRKALSLPVPSADPARRAALLQDLQTMLARHGGTPVTALRRALRPLLLDGMPSMADAARSLGLSSRTLRRRLAQENLTFEEIRDDVRFTVARELLALTDLPIGDIAEALAFSTHAAFTNAFQRWSGKAPSTWRTTLTRSATVGPEQHSAKTVAETAT